MTSWTCPRMTTRTMKCVSFGADTRVTSPAKVAKRFTLAPSWSFRRAGFTPSANARGCALPTSSVPERAQGPGVRVNAISPGSTDTPGIDGLFGEEQAADVKAKLAAGVPISRMGRPEEVAAVVAFLASAQSSFIVGANVYVDGGENQL